MFNPVEWHRARTLSFAAGTALPAETVALGEAAGRRLAADVAALVDVPHYSSSAMDGWAVSGAPPWRLVHPARADQTAPLRAGEATPILTGSPVPPGTLGILRSEHGDTSPDGTSPEGTVLRPNVHARPGEPRRDLHVRPRGEEAAAGDIVFTSGALLTPAHVAVLAACGHDAVVVRRRPRIGLVMTGDEVVESGIPGDGRVRDSFGPSLPAMLAFLGGEVVSVVHLPDDRALLVEALGPAASDMGECDVLITTGGTGASSADHLHHALSAHGAETLIDGVRMRPGGPSLLARLPDGRVVLGLPGNPLAAVMGLLTLGEPLIAALSGTALDGLDQNALDENALDENALNENALNQSALDTITLGVRIAGAEGRVSLVPFVHTHGRAHPTAWRGSGMLRGLAAAHGVLVVPPGGGEVDQRVPVLPLPWVRG